MTPAAHFVRMGVDIDEAAVHLALGRTVAQNAHRFGKGSIDQNRTVDQRNLFHLAPVAVFRHDPLDKGRAAVPWIAFLCGQRVDLAQLQGREGPRKTRRGARGEDQFQRRGNALSWLCRGVGAKADGKAVLALLDRLGAVQVKRLRVPRKVGCSDEQVDGVAGRKQRRIGLSRCHRIQGLAQQLGKTQPAKRRFEPARADQARELGPHFAPGFGRDAGRDEIARALEQPVNDGHGPELGNARSGPGIGIKQHVHVSPVQPEPGQRLKALPGMKRLGQEHAIDSARTGPGDDIGQDPQAQFEMALDPVKQAFVNRFRAAAHRRAAMESAAGAGQFPQLLGHAVHVNGKADTAVADQGDAEFLLAHGHLFPRPMRSGNCVLITFQLGESHGQTETSIHLPGLRQRNPPLAGAMRRLRGVEHLGGRGTGNGLFGQA